MTVRRLLAGLAVAAAALTAVTAAGGANECDGLQICVPVAGPWVLVPKSGAAPRPRVEYQLSCPRGYIIGGLDARLSERGVDVQFFGALGSPVNPGITTSRSAVFVASHVGGRPQAPSFKPFVGCVPARGGGSRVPTSVTAFSPGPPTARRVKTVRIRPGATAVAQGCLRGERLVGAAHAVAFFTSAPPSPSLAASVRTEQSIRDGRVVVRARGDAELGGARAVVQVQAVCARTV